MNYLLKYERIQKALNTIYQQGLVLKEWDSSSGTTIYDVIYGCSTPIEVTNQRFYLNKSFERLKQVVGNFLLKDEAGRLMKYKIYGLEYLDIIH